MGSLLFYYFIEILISGIFLIAVIYQVYFKRKFKIVGNLFIFLCICFLFLRFLSQPRFGLIKNHYLSYKSLSEQDVLEINYYKSIDDLHENAPYHKVKGIKEIESFLERANLENGLYFKDVVTNSGYGDYLILLVAKKDKYLFEVMNDTDGTETINFYYSINDLEDLIGRYYW